MASSAPSAIALPNGAPTTTPMQLDANEDSSQSAIAAPKRKLENVDDQDMQGTDATAIPAGAPVAEDPSESVVKRDIISRKTLGDYLLLLERFDTTPSILKRPLPDLDPSSEPPFKRQKSVDPKSPRTIVDKFAQRDYDSIDDFVADLKTSIDNQLADLRQVEDGDDPRARHSAIAQVFTFRKQAYELLKREISYTLPDGVLPDCLQMLQPLDPAEDLQSNIGGSFMLSVFGDAPRPRTLYSSLQQSTQVDAEFNKEVRPLSEIELPNGIKLVKVVSTSLSPIVDQDKKSKTLGELFPAPRTLLSLPPPKAPKSTTKGVQVGWHRPELTEKSKYRVGSYFSQPLSAGKWLDYSNASSMSQTTKQRERALSLAGNKPSSLEVEASELESLFRGAFSSFAPSKDDSAAMISSGWLSRTLWWQKVGQRSFDRLVDSERIDECEDEAAETKDDQAADIDEEFLQHALDNWDDNLIDPSLQEACCPQKSQAEKDTDDILQDVSDMIQTLISYQRNRNLVLPTASSQSRYGSDPANSDMLTNGTQAQPGEEETATYEALKAQLLLVIQMLPPYAVARLNSDKLGELNISTKLEVRTDEYQGTMEEDEAAARARAAQNAAAAANARPVSHRSSSSSNNIQYNQPYHQHAGRAPAQAPPFYPVQTPVRPPQPVMQRAPPQTMPPNYQQRPPSNAGYRPSNAYQHPGYAAHPQYVKPTAAYTQPSYTQTPPPARPVYSTPNSKYMPNYNNMGHMGNGSPQQHRYQGYQPPTAHPHYQPHQPPAPTPSHGPYGHYPNGAGAIPPRTTTASPHVHHQPPHSPQVPQQGYHPVATPTRQPSYSGPSHMPNNQQRPYYPGTPVLPPMQSHQMPSQHHIPNQIPQAPATSFQTSLSTHQVQQAMDQAKARFNAQQNAQKPNEPHGNAMVSQGQPLTSPSQSHPGPPVGLGGIGLGANPAQMAAARAGQPGSVSYPQANPGPQSQVDMTNVPHPMNGNPAVPHAAVVPLPSVGKLG